MTDQTPAPEPAPPTPAPRDGMPARPEAGARRVEPDEAVAGADGLVLQVARGFTMGSADLVPGVSGGTMALVFGIYDPLLATIGQAATSAGRFVKGDFRGALTSLRNVSWRFLVPLLGGVALAVFVLSGPLKHLLETYPVVMSAAFFGLVVGSVVVTVDNLQRRDASRAATLILVATGTFILLGLRGSPVRDPALPTLLAGGALAVCAMILPGISGSLILVIIGLYDVVLAAVEARDLYSLATVAVGAAVGLALFSKLLDWLLERHHDTVMAALIGLMVGSLRVLWMWPAGDGVEDVRLGAPVVADIPSVFAAVVVAVVAVLLAARVGRVRGS